MVPRWRTRMAPVWRSSRGPRGLWSRSNPPEPPQGIPHGIPQASMRGFTQSIPPGRPQGTPWASHSGRPKVLQGIFQNALEQSVHAQSVIVNKKMGSNGFTHISPFPPATFPLSSNHDIFMYIPCFKLANLSKH